MSLDVIHFYHNLDYQKGSIYTSSAVWWNYFLIASANNATCERVFSALNRIKTYLRNICGQKLSNYLMILHVYCSDTGQLDLENVTTEFVGDSNKRLSISDRFT